MSTDTWGRIAKDLRDVVVALDAFPAEERNGRGGQDSNLRPRD
jgi:hypothetical protein